MTIKEYKIDFEKIKERVKSTPEVECTGKCYGCQAECINRIPEIPEETAVKILSFLEARKIALQIREVLPEKGRNLDENRNQGYAVKGSG